MEEHLNKIDISDLTPLEELSDEALSTISGGRYKKPLSEHGTVGLSTPDGDPIDVYVDGVRVNSVTTGYYPR
jgi:bacteriocin-like protein